MSSALFAAAGEHSAAETAVALTIFAVAALTLWLLPTIIAVRRRVLNVGTIAVLNVFLGWMPVMWVVCLALACQTAPPRPPRLVYVPPVPPWPPPPPPLISRPAPVDIRTRTGTTTQRPPAASTSSTVPAS